MVERGYSPAYAEDHGCASGKSTSGWLFAEAQKNEARCAASESEYTQGWDAGYARCMADMCAMVIDARTRNPSRDR